MMTTYTTREAEARFGEILHKVRMGERVVLVEEGKDVAEIRPVEGEAPALELEVAMRELIEDGTIIPAEAPRQTFVPAGKSPGALARFLESRR
jgi:antitoxin (DNA-binding transcriptional repressor) of toxin-antitoxin stability system